MFLTDIGIDIGTSKTLICEKNKGIILNEPSIIAIDKKTQKILGIGLEALNMIGKESTNVKIIHPLENGIIKDVDALELIINEFIKKVKTQNVLLKPRIIIGSPIGITELEKDILRDIFLKIGARKVKIEPSIKLAAIGVGMDISKPIANMIIDIGASKTEIAVLSLNDIVVEKSVKIGGNKFNETIIKYIREKYKVLIGETTSENIKLNYINVNTKNTYNIEIKGKDLITGLPTIIKINNT